MFSALFQLIVLCIWQDANLPRSVYKEASLPPALFCREKKNPLFLPTSKNWFWVCLVTCLPAFSAPRHQQLPACAATSILAGMWDWARKENSPRWKKAFQSRELPWLYGRHGVSHTDNAFLTQWFTGWWAQPCDYIDTLTLPSKPDKPGHQQQSGCSGLEAGEICRWSAWGEFCNTATLIRATEF